MVVAPASDGPAHAFPQLGRRVEVGVPVNDQNPRRRAKALLLDPELGKIARSWLQCAWSPRVYSRRTRTV